MSSLNLKTDTKGSEFELLLSSNLSIDDIESDTYHLSKIFERKITNAVTEIVDSVLPQNHDTNPQTVLQNISSKIPSTALVRYARAGKNYVSIDHVLGDMGNLFFNGVFEKLVQDNLVQNHHTIIQDNKICFVFRQ